MSSEQKFATGGGTSELGITLQALKTPLSLPSLSLLLPFSWFFESPTMSEARSDFDARPPLQDDSCDITDEGDNVVRALDMRRRFS